MIAEIRHFALILSFTLALAQSIVPLIGARHGDAKFMRFGSSAAVGQLIVSHEVDATLIARFGRWRCLY